MSFRPAARQFFERRGAPTPPLPYDAEVEYLESTGTQYIDTEYPTTGAGISVDLIASKTTSSTTEMGVVGRTGSSGFEIYFYNGKIYLWNQAFDLASNVSVAVDTAYHIVAVIGSEEQSLTVDGDSVSRTGSASSVSPLNIAIFRHSHYYFSGRVYLCKIYDGATLVRDLIPVRFTNSNGQSEGALYDRVSGQVFRNAGTGAFLWAEKQ